MLGLHDIYKSYDNQPLLCGISLRVHLAETVCLLGPSGSGKSTLLQIVAGLQSPDSGKVMWQRQDLASTPPHLRDFGLVFQDYALFPHLDVFENVAFGLKMKKWSPGEIAARVAEVLQLVNLGEFGDRSVADLSGGEQQRVALARALAPRPRLLMFDEPLGALDHALRDELLEQLRLVLQRTGIPALYVTHDQDEAFKLADRVLVLHAGRIVRAGTPAQVWGQPGSAWVAEFLGLGNILSGTVLTGNRSAVTPFGVFALTCTHRHRAGESIQLLVRSAPASRGKMLEGVVRDSMFQHDRYEVTLLNGLRFDMPAAPRIGSKVSVKVKPECLGRDSGR